MRTEPQSACSHSGARAPLFNQDVKKKKKTYLFTETPLNVPSADRIHATHLSLSDRRGFLFFFPPVGLFVFLAETRTKPGTAVRAPRTEHVCRERFTRAELKTDYSL